MINKIGLAILLGMLVAACTKGPTEDNGYGGGNVDHQYNGSDTIPPVINISTPAPNQVFANGTVINVTGNLTDNNGLYRGSIRITDDANGAVLRQQLYEIHGLTNYYYNVSYTPHVAMLSNFTVTLSFEDHGYNTTTKTVKVKVNP